MKNTTSSTPGSTPGAGAVPSPLSAAQSPAAVGSPHGSEGTGSNRRPSSRKSDSGSSKSKANVSTEHSDEMQFFSTLPLCCFCSKLC